MPREVIDVDELLRKKAEAESVASEADAAIERHHAAIAAERERREREFDAGTVHEFDQRHKAMLLEEQAARKLFEAAVLETPVIAAWIKQRAIRWSRVALHAEVQNASSRLGGDREYPAMDARDPLMLEEVVRLAEREAMAQGYDAIDAAITTPRDRHIYSDDKENEA